MRQTGITGLLMYTGCALAHEAIFCDRRTQFSPIGSLLVALCLKIFFQNLKKNFRGAFLGDVIYMICIAWIRPHHKRRVSVYVKMPNFNAEGVSQLDFKASRQPKGSGKINTFKVANHPFILQLIHKKHASPNKYQASLSGLMVTEKRQPCHSFRRIYPDDTR